jgi:hypothetical protein
MERIHSAFVGISEKAIFCRHLWQYDYTSQHITLEINNRKCLFYCYSSMEMVNDGSKQ